MKRIFDSIVLISLALTVAIWVIPLYDHNWLSDQELNLLNASGWGAFFPYPNYIYWPMLLFWSITSVGLYLRIKIARTIFLIGIVIFAIANFGWGFAVQTQLEAGLTNIITLLDGAILTMAFLTTVNNEFEKT